MQCRSSAAMRGCGRWLTCCYLAADGMMLDWVGPGTNLPPDFAALRVETNDLRVVAQVWLPDAQPDGWEADRVCSESAVQLLCRALRLAPLCHRCFELAVDDPDRYLMIHIKLELICGDEIRLSSQPEIDSAQFDDAAGLGAAMQQYAAAEELRVEVTPDLRCRWLPHRVLVYGMGG